MESPKRFHMRRKEKEVTDSAEINQIMKEAKVCHLGFIDDDEPYIVPVNFGYAENRIYFHSAREGRKVNIIKKNNKVCFNIIADWEVENSPTQCKVKFRSVTGTGTASIVEDNEERVTGLKLLMLQNLGHEYNFPPGWSDKTLVVRIDIQDIKGKKSS